MSQYEYDRLIGSLSSMININNFKVDPELFLLAKRKKIVDLNKSIDIAKFWLDNCKKIPFPIAIKRDLPDRSIEIWYPMEMLLPEEIETDYNFDSEINV